jgi:hypothetical protein
MVLAMVFVAVFVGIDLFAFAVGLSGALALPHPLNTMIAAAVKVSSKRIAKVRKDPHLSLRSNERSISHLPKKRQSADPFLGNDRRGPNYARNFTGRDKDTAKRGGFSRVKMGVMQS